MDSDFELMREGFELNASRAKSIESQLSLNPPDSYGLRLRLLGFLFQKSIVNDHYADKFHEQLEWLIGEQPANPIHQFLTFSKNCRQYKRSLRSWLEQVRLNSENTAVLHNAANFCCAWSPLTSEKLYKAAENLEPSSDTWPLALSELYVLHAQNTSPEHRRRQIGKAIRAMERAISIYQRTSDKADRANQYNMTTRSIRQLASECGLDLKTSQLTL